MRKDMHKVVIERPRWNPGPGKNGRRANLPDELQPKFEGIRRPHTNRKAFTDLLGPLRRWLQSQVGRPWNDVYSEACEVIKPDSIIRMHIKTHLFEFVERHTFMHEGKVCVIRTWGYKTGIVPLTAPGFGRNQFYVHPETGILEFVKPRSRSEWRELHREKQAETFRWLDGNIALKRINGVWFACHFREIIETGPFKVYDHALGQTVGRGGLMYRDGRFLHCFVKRQLSRRELRRYELRNNHDSASTAFSAHKCIEARAGRKKEVGKKKMRGGMSNEIGAPASGILANWQLLTPRRKLISKPELEARLFRRAILFISKIAQFFEDFLSTAYSPISILTVTAMEDI